MSFDWNQYLELAKKLAVETSDDASLRSAISRSYYCVFNIARARAEANSFRVKDDAGSHEQIWSLYGRNDSDPGCLKLATIGPRLKRRRVKADYRPFVFKLDQEVADAIADAEEIISTLAELAKELPKDVPRSFSY